MYPWPEKRLLIAVPLVGVGLAPSYIPPAIARFLPLWLLLVPSALRLPSPLSYNSLSLQLKALFSFKGGSGALSIDISG